MDYTTLGRTGLRVSVLGLGAGGPSRLGLSRGRSEADAAAVVRRALELGVNFIDTAETYDTERAIGRAVAEAGRESVVLATKAAVRTDGDRFLRAAELEACLDASLSRLGTDHVDVYQLHAVLPREYDHALGELAPAMLKMRDKGKLRFLGITEEFIIDTGHQMLRRAVRDDCWDVMMVGFNLLNQSARPRVFAATRARNIGTLIMFAVRRALSRPGKLADLIARLAKEGRIDPARPDETGPPLTDGLRAPVKGPLGFLLAEGVAESLPDAAYRYCRHEPGCDVVLSGTGDVAHLERNVASAARPPLPQHIRDRLADLFADVDHVSGN